MKRFSTLVILFLALCAALILLTRGCAKEKEPEPTPTPVATPVPEDTEPTPTPAPTPEPTPSILGPVWVTGEDGVNLRRGPGTDSDIIVAVDKGTELRRTGTTDNNWSRVIYQNVGYYVDSSYVSTTAPVQEETDENAEGSSETAAPAAETSAETSGEFRSNTGTPMDLVVRWSVTGGEGGKKLTLNAYVSSLTLQAEPFADDLTFKVGSNTFNVTSKAVNVESNTAVETLLGTCTADVDQASVPVTVTWHFNGTYNGTELQDVAATANLNLGA